MSREARWSLAGATALVTGGSKGIGHAIVEELAGHGARVHTCARSAAELEECRRRWEARGLPVTVSVCDVSLRAQREQLVETVKQVFDAKLDILVNNAAQALAKAAVECTSEEYTHLMSTNLEPCFHLSKLTHPLLLGASIAGGGSIVNISSIGGTLGFPGYALYGITKGRTRHFREGVGEGSDAAGRRARGRGCSGVIPLHASGILRHWAGHHRRWWSNN
ncbi:tropinone reductase homolog At2g29360-like isoform X2 [Triticum dicoccoides]|uniref:tropinone reductase homolog At2g29360-like isoform X2 n=1 Tax=Triticum dicoccoides TaxID=85692 RepID=UPI001890A31B|nr:tropinone reductase homolog At2g29360-like isoform X2 [Triticum dicoccoides]